MRPAPQPGDWKRNPHSITVVYCPDGAQRHDPFKNRQEAVTWAANHQCVCSRTKLVLWTTEVYSTHDVRTF